MKPFAFTISIIMHRQYFLFHDGQFYQNATTSERGLFILAATRSFVYLPTCVTFTLIDIKPAFPNLYWPHWEDQGNISENFYNLTHTRFKDERLFWAPPKFGVSI